MARYYTVRNQKYCKKITILIISVCLIFSLFLTSILFDVKHTANAANSIEIVMEASTYRVLYSNNKDVRMPMASTTKALTLLVAIEKGDLNQIITIPKEAVGIEGSSIYLVAGEKITLKDLCYGLILRSGNDAATAIALTIGGSIEGFAKLMNDKVSELGLKNSNFTNPHGLHDDNHYTSAYDLAVISSYAMQNPTFREIAATKQIRISGPNNTVRLLNNKNKILSLYKDGNGIKTGFTKKAGRCLIASSERDGMQLVSVVLNCPPMFERCMSLMDSAHNDYEMKKIAVAGQSICGMNVKGGTVSRMGICLDNDLIIPVKKDGSDEILTSLLTPDYINAPHNNANSIGELEIRINNDLLFTKKLYTIKSIKEKGVLDHFNDIINEW